MNLSMKWLSEFVTLDRYVPQRVRRSDDHERLQGRGLGNRRRKIR